MGFFLLSLFFCGFFAFGFLLILQYIFITFQNRRLAGEIITKRVLALPSFGQSYNRALMVLTARDKPIWLTRIVLRMDKIWQNLAKKINKLIKYFQTLTNKEIEEEFKTEVKADNLPNSQNNLTFLDNSLTRQKDSNSQQNLANLKINPNNLSKDSDDNFDDLESLDNFEPILKEKISNSISQIPNINSQLNPIKTHKSVTNPIKTRKSVTGNIWDNLEEEIEGEQNEQLTQIKNTNQNTATIGMIGGATKNTGEMTPFEKQENKILIKLQSLQENNLGLNHWDLWLELGDLYGKYAQKDKQKEIYTFILSKADNSDKEKELATFRLIGMN